MKKNWGKEMMRKESKQEQKIDIMDKGKRIVEAQKKKKLKRMMQRVVEAKKERNDGKRIVEKLFTAKRIVGK